MADDASLGPRLVVGLTGGIASGKSIVGAMFVGLGAALVDTDILAREVVAPGEPGLAAVRAEFGDAIVLPTGALNRAALRKLVFGDEARRRKLEAILHPLIRERIGQRLAAVHAPYALVAVPLLVETDFAELVDRILVVDCPEAVQLERLMARDALSRADALAMLRSQTDRATRLQAAHDVIDNGGTTEATLRQVQRLHHQYLELKVRGVGRS